MEPYKYELEMDMPPADIKGKMAGIAKHALGIYAFNKLRKVSKENQRFNEEESKTVEPEQQIVNTYVFYEAGIIKVDDMLKELFDRYMEYCPNPDPDVIDRAVYVFSLMEYVRGVQDGTEA